MLPSSPSAQGNEAVLAYHERSKHQLGRYAPGPGYLDWVNQPDPFRTYRGAPRVALSLRADALTTRFADVRAGQLPAAAPFTHDTISTLFELSLAISAWKSLRGSSWALRCNPSSGNLHPTEGYLVCADLPGVPAGIYHYVSRDHVLECRASLSDTAQWDTGGVVVGLASIYWREAWKYGMRAFRYCQHDCGHAIGALAYAAAALGWQTRMLDAASDDEVATLLGLDREADYAGVEREAPDCLLWVGQGQPPAIEILVAAARGASWGGRPNRLSSSHVEWSDIDLVHSATRKPHTNAARSTPAAAFDLAAPALDLAAAALVRQRRSAVDFDGETGLYAEALYGMLEPLLPRAATAPWNAWPWAPRVHLALFLHRIEGLEAGLYVLLRDPSALDSLRQAQRPEWLWHKSGPPQLPLYLLLPHDLRDVAKLVCCHQDIAGDSCYALGMIASFEDVQAAPWRYPRLYWECGLVGHTLYLEAEAAGIRATGIGCYFDDEMHRLLGLHSSEWQSLYHFTAGGAVEDTRLTTLPPYGPSPSR